MQDNKGRVGSLSFPSYFLCSTLCFIAAHCPLFPPSGTPHTHTHTHMHNARRKNLTNFFMQTLLFVGILGRTQHAAFVRIICIFTAIYLHVAWSAGFLVPLSVKLIVKLAWWNRHTLNVSECIRKISRVDPFCALLSQHHCERRSNADLQVQLVIKMGVGKSEQRLVCKLWQQDLSEWPFIMAPWWHSTEGDRQVNQQRTWIQHTQLPLIGNKWHYFIPGTREVFLQLPIEHFEPGFTGENGGVWIMWPSCLVNSRSECGAKQPWESRGVGGLVGSALDRTHKHIAV